MNLGDEVQVRVDDIDDRGKVSLSLLGPDGQPIGGGEASGEASSDRAPRERTSERGPRDRGNDRGDNRRGDSRGGRGDNRGGGRSDSRRNDSRGAARPDSRDSGARREPNRGAAAPSDVVSVSFEDEFNNEERNGK